MPVSLAAENAPCQVVRQRPAELRSWAKRIHESSSICTCSSLIHQTYPVHVCLIQVLSCFRRGVGMKKTPRSGWWLARILSHFVYSPRPVRIDNVKGDLIEYLYKDGRDSYMCTKWNQIASTCIKPSTQSITCCAYCARGSSDFATWIVHCYELIMLRAPWPSTYFLSSGQKQGLLCSKPTRWIDKLPKDHHLLPFNCCLRNTRVVVLRGYGLILWQHRVVL